MLFVPLAAPGAVEPLRVHDGVNVRAASDNQQLRHDRAQPAAAGASPPAAVSAEPRDCARLKSKADITQREGHHLGDGLVRAGHVAVSYRHPKVRVMPDCRASTAAASSRAVWAAPAGRVEAGVSTPVAAVHAHRPGVLAGCPRAGADGVGNEACRGVQMIWLFARQGSRLR
jgi:hypothetical protein